MDSQDMISVEEALERILSYFERLEPETQPITDALGQVLAEDVRADFDIPPLDNTAMDGYAVIAADTAAAREAKAVAVSGGGVLGGEESRQGGRSTNAAPFKQCPKCAQASLVHEEGCDNCRSCGYSRGS